MQNKKQIKGFRILLAVLLAVLPLLFVTGVAAETVEAPSATEVPSTAEEGGDWQTLLSEKVIPIAVFGITAIGSVYVAIAPVLNRMKNAAGNMDTAAGGVKESAEASRTATARVEEFHGEAVKLREEINTLLDANREQLSGIDKSLADRLSAYAERVDRLETEVEKVEEMLAIGLGNTEELVRKGYAKVLFSLWEGKSPEEASETEEKCDEA